MKSRQFVASALLAGGLAFTTGACGDSTPRPSPNVTLEAQDMTIIKPGSTFVEAVTDTSVRQRLTQSLALNKSQNPNGFEDSTAPTISEAPIRILARVAVKGHLPVSHSVNDASCDTLGVDFNGFQDKRAARIGVIALSDDASDQVQINWAQKADGEPTDFVQVCVADNHEPVDGVVLVMTHANPSQS